MMQPSKCHRFGGNFLDPYMYGSNRKDNIHSQRLYGPCRLGPVESVTRWTKIPSHNAWALHRETVMKMKNSPAQLLGQHGASVSLFSARSRHQGPQLFHMPMTVCMTVFLQPVHSIIIFGRFYFVSSANASLYFLLFTSTFKKKMIPHQVETPKTVRISISAQLHAFFQEHIFSLQQQLKMNNFIHLKMFFQDQL